MAGGKHTPRVYVEAPLAVGDECELPAAKRHHLISVLRLECGSALSLFNGDGGEYAARVVEATRKRLIVSVDARRTPRRESPLAITLVQAIARGDRMDFALAKAVELGVTAIRPVFTARGKVRLADERLAKKHAHWQRVVESAAEQSARLIRPEVAQPMPLAAVLGQSPAPDTLRLMLAPSFHRSLSALAPKKSVALLVGPESGLSDAEQENAAAAGWQAIALGARVLRTETAGMAALAALQTLWGDLGG